MWPEILDRVKAKGHAVFDRGAYNLNIIGVRSRERRCNEYDDRIHCVYRDDAMRWVEHVWPATTDPGLFWLREPANVDGTAIMVAGQYRGVYAIGLHAGMYKALVQRHGPVKVYRDRNRDDFLDLDPRTIQEGYFGINIHNSGQSRFRRPGEKQVGKWSAGCQVFADPMDFARFMELCAVQAAKGKGWDRFTYTLLEDHV